MNELKAGLSTDKEAMAYFSCSRKTLLKLSQEAGAIYRFGRVVRFDVEKIREYIEREQTVVWKDEVKS